MHLNTTDLDFRPPKAHFYPRHGRLTHALTRFPPSSLKWAHGPWGRAWEGPGPIGPMHVGAKKLEYLSGVAWRRASCRFPKSFFLRETYVLRQSARIVFYSRKRMPLLSQATAALSRRGHPTRIKSLSSASARRMNDMSSRWAFWAFWDSGRNSASYGPHTQRTEWEKIIKSSPIPSAWPV